MNKQEIEKAIGNMQSSIKAYESNLRSINTVNSINKDWDRKASVGQTISIDDKRYIHTLDNLKACKVAIFALQQQLTNGWIPVDSKPDSDRPVEVTARRKTGARGYFVLKACYVAPHTQTTEDYGWDIGNVDGEYDEEKDCYWIPECWYEDNAISDNENWILDDEFDITAWRELSEPYKEDTDAERN